jgi:hypothetical protein
MRRVLYLFSICWLLNALNACKPHIPDTAKLIDTPGDSLDITHKWCSRCHIFPAPELLTKKIWREQVLPNMGYRLGIKQPGYSPVGAYDMMEQTLIYDAKVYPDSPLISNNDWAKITSYIISHAPDSLEALWDTISLMDQFAVKPMGDLIPLPRVTLLSFDSTTHQIHIGIESGAVYSFDQGWKPIDTVQVRSTPIDYVTTRDGGLILNIGKLYPSERKTGSLSIYKDGHLREVLNDLHRPVSITLVDINGDHEEDALISEFGFETGRLSWFEGHDSGYVTVPRILKNTPGAVKSILQDMDGDGIQDIVILMAQGDEHVSVYKINRTGIQKEYKILRFPPVHGVCDMDITDMNQDGLPDLVVANGDNADYSPVLKPYHGITIYLNRGNFQFDQILFLPYPGVLHCIAYDFDQDGDIDIAATSFFPGDESHPFAPFKYFENRKGKYIGKTFLGAKHGKWMQMIRGDFDLDGDQDLLLGSFLLNNFQVVGSKEELKKNGLVLLTNKARHNLKPNGK